MTRPVATIASDFTALQAFLEKAADLVDRRPAFERAFAGLDLNEAVAMTEAAPDGPGRLVVIVRPPPRWVDLFRKHGGVWP